MSNMICDLCVQSAPLSMYGAPQYFVCVAWVITNTYIKNIQIDHGNKPATIGISNISANIAPFFITDDCHSPYKCTQLTLCSNPHGKEEPLSSPSQEIVDSDVWHHRILMRSEKKSRAIFYPANSGLSLLPSFLKVGGNGGVRRSKIGEFIVFFHFSQRTCMKSHLFHAIFPKSAANMQQSTFKKVRN